MVRILQLKCDKYTTKNLKNMHHDFLIHYFTIDTTRDKYQDYGQVIFLQLLKEGMNHFMSQAFEL